MKFCRPFIAYTKKAFKINGRRRFWAHFGTRFWSTERACQRHVIDL